MTVVVADFDVRHLRIPSGAVTVSGSSSAQPHTSIPPAGTVTLGQSMRRLSGVWAATAAWATGRPGSTLRNASTVAAPRAFQEGWASLTSGQVYASGSRAPAMRRYVCTARSSGTLT
ncbi:MAG: hypothetical protein ACRDJO_02775, partial [Actinomycetota bacterium]